MRPRRIRLGYSILPDVQILMSAASMRPRRMRLGYMPRARPGRATRPGFNEAEAHAPRIPLDGLMADLALQGGFNEAEAHAPRIQGLQEIKGLQEMLQ